MIECKLTTDGRTVRWYKLFAAVPRRGDYITIAEGDGRGRTKVLRLLVHSTNWQIHHGTNEATPWVDCTIQKKAKP